MDYASRKYKKKGHTKLTRKKIIRIRIDKDCVHMVINKID